MGEKANLLSGRVEAFAFLFQSFLVKCFVPFPLFAGLVVSLLNFSMYLFVFDSSKEIMGKLRLR